MLRKGSDVKKPAFVLLGQAVCQDEGRFSPEFALDELPENSLDEKVE